MSASNEKTSLEKYRAKRSSQTTPEPFGGTPISGINRFVVQHHAATRTHYDFRLEWNGVLKSWAVPKGPSPNTHDKRLAVQTEDHPIDYVDFEGLIPEGNYGAGAVIVWDRGCWLPLNEIEEGFSAGKLLFELRGYKLHGKWTLVKTKRGTKDWLLIKERDAHVDTAGTDGYPADSVYSGLTVEQLKAGGRPGEDVTSVLRAEGATRVELPIKDFKPMLAKPGKPFSDPGWVFEIKYDGYRIVACKADDRVSLFSRNGHDLTKIFPDIEQSIGRLPYQGLMIDGEAVVHDSNGLPSFSLLQKRGRLSRPRDIQRATIDLPATLYAFDLLVFDNLDARRLPLLQRKEFLQSVLPTVGAIRYSDHIDENGELMFERVADMGVEGIVAKRSSAAYSCGRSDDWLKIAVDKNDDFVIVGYTDSHKTPGGFGALLLAQYIDGELTYTGRVGTGFDRETMAVIKRMLLKSNAAEKPPCRSPAEKNLHWTEPRYVAQIKYKQITPEGMLRAPAFVALRNDKETTECHRDYFQHDLPAPESVQEIATEEKEIRFTNQSKVFWPDDGYTKGDLIEYYRRISAYILPYLKDRPVVLTRFPDGIDGKSFYQKDAPDFAPAWIRREKLWSGHAEREISYFVIEDLESLLYIVNMGTIPIHMWSSRTDSLERPDWCILDLDPKQASFRAVVEIAQAIHSLCNSVALPHYVKTSGSTGLHILIPLGANYTYDHSRTLGEVLARMIVQQLPQIATIVRSPANRGNKVYIDYLQNRHGQTIVAPFSVRPLAGAPVSTPLYWKEVSVRNRNEKFTINNTLQRTRRLDSDPLVEILQTKLDLGEVLQRLQQEMMPDG